MSKQSTDTLKYLTDKSIIEVKKEKAPYLFGQILLILLGLLLIVLGSTPIEFAGYSLPESVRKIFESLGHAFVVGTAISVILDLPYMQKYYKSRIVDVLVGNEYLNSLPESELERLRKECTEKIYLKKTKHFEQSLLNLDESISKLLTEPYISKYRIELTCYKEGDNIRKRANIKYWIENPLHAEAIEDFDGKVGLYAIKDIPKENLFKVNKFAVKIDDNPSIDLATKVDYKFTDDNDDAKQGHNFVVSLVEKGIDKPFSFRFGTTLEIEIEDERLVPNNDNIYTKRIKLPTKNFQIHYNVIGMECKLQGVCLGTMLKGHMGHLRTVTNENSISIESFDWLLPGNGIMIAAIPK